MSTPAPVVQRCLAQFKELPASSRDQKRLTKLLSFGADLPEIGFDPVGERHLALKVRRKTFAYYLNNHHGDGQICICCKSSAKRQQELIAAASDRYFFPAYLGVSGWVSLRLDRARIDWDEVFELLLAAFRLQAPRRIAAEME